MVRRHTNIMVGIFCGVLGLVGPTSLARADTPLTHAEVQNVRNQVDFIPQGSSARLAQISDRLVPGDALSTYQSAFAELEFNDGSLARVGELVLFRFQPDTRTFELDNGTLLLLIPPNQGTSRVRTPNATAGIRGSGLFVRHIEGNTPEQSITLVGALTTSGITVANVDSLPDSTDAEETQENNSATSAEATVELEAGHMAVIVGNNAPQLFTFDIGLFYETSALAAGLELAGEDADITSIWREETVDGEHLLSVIADDGSDAGESTLDPIALVREETQDGLQAQAGTLTTPYIDNPPFVSGGRWQPGTVLLPVGQANAIQINNNTGNSVSETLDALIDAADIQFTQPTPQIGVEPPVSEPPEPTRIPGPDPIMGPTPAEPGVIEPPSPPTVLEPPTVPEPPIPTEPPTPVIPETPIFENPTPPATPPAVEPPTPPDQPDIFPNPDPPAPTPEEPPTQVPPNPTPDPSPSEPPIEPGPEPSSAAEPPSEPANPGPAPNPGTSPVGDTPEVSSPPAPSDVPGNTDTPVTPPTEVFPDATNNVPDASEDSSMGPEPLEPIEGGFDVNPQ